MTELPETSSSSSSFGGLHVAAFESRRADEIARLISKRGGVPHVSPSLREVPIAENPAAVDFAHRLLSGQVDVVLLLTGVGTRQMVAQVERHVDRERFLAALSDVTTVARGPKPVAALRELGLKPTFTVPEPNTWRELLQTLDQHVPVDNHVVAIQEYGVPNPSLVAGLEARGAKVMRVKVYDWDFPLDPAPLAENVQALARGSIDVVLFTSAHQVVNLLRMAERLDLLGTVRSQLQRTAVGSIGPTTSEMLEVQQIAVDFEPEHSKMGQLVSAAADRAPAIVQRKRNGSAPRMMEQMATTTEQPAWYDSPFMKACRLEPCDTVPVWLMRQAGRYMAEYRDIRAKTTFLALCKNPQLCAEVMLTAVGRLGVDAAIIFSDLLPMLEPMGVDLEFAAGEGPVIHNPVREAADVDRIRPLENLDALQFVMETVRLTRAGLPERLPVIGFAGAPFTLASYVIEGGGSRQYTNTKRLMYSDEPAWHELMSRLAQSVALYLRGQIAAGAQAVQLFDSWVGALGPEDYRRYVLPHTKAVIDGLPQDVPCIHFANGNPMLLPLAREAGGAVLGVDWRTSLADAWRTIGYDRAVQGNLDPAVLLGPRNEIRRQVLRVLREAGGRPGHIFNLGHGIYPQTDVEHAIALVDAVHELGPQPAAG